MALNLQTADINANEDVVSRGAFCTCHSEHHPTLISPHPYRRVTECTCKPALYLIFYFAYKALCSSTNEGEGKLQPRSL